LYKSNIFKKICIASYTTRNIKGAENIIAGCTIRKIKRKNESHLSLMRVIFVFFSSLKSEYIEVMEVQEVTIEVQEESLPTCLA